MGFGSGHGVFWKSLTLSGFPVTSSRGIVTGSVAG